MCLVTAGVTARRITMDHNWALTKYCLFPISDRPYQNMCDPNLFYVFQKTRMPGTVKCRPTVAYWVQIDGINIATELITRYYLNGTLIQCCFNARPTSATLAQHWINVQCLRESPPGQQTQDICITFIQRRPNVFDFGPTLHKVIQMFCVYWACQYKLGSRSFNIPAVIQSVCLQASDQVGVRAKIFEL